MGGAALELMGSKFRKGHPPPTPRLFKIGISGDGIRGSLRRREKFQFKIQAVIRRGVKSVPHSSSPSGSPRGVANVHLHGAGQPLFSAHCPFVTQRPRVSFQLSLGRAATLITAASSVHWVTVPQGSRGSLLKAFGCRPGFCTVCHVNTVSHPHECFKEDSPKGARKGNTLLHVARSDHITLHTSGPAKAVHSHIHWRLC